MNGREIHITIISINIYEFEFWKVIKFNILFLTRNKRLHQEKDIFLLSRRNQIRHQKILIIIILPYVFVIIYKNNMGNHFYRKNDSFLILLFLTLLQN